MKNIVVIMGGQSTEHDISLITGVQTINNIDKTKYVIYPIVIDKQGKWHFSFNFVSVEKIIKYFDNKKHYKEAVLLSDKSLYQKSKNKLKKQCLVDCVILCCHGGTGENGALQGLIECVGLPFVSPNHLESGVFMNKAMSKIIFQNRKINTPKYMLIKREDYIQNEKSCINTIKDELAFPVVVKPNNGGSSIGIGVASSKMKLKELIENAFIYDSDVVVEKAVENLFELNIAVAKINDEIIISQIERPCNKNKLLSFDDKYISSGKSGLTNMERQLPAIITESQKDFVESTAKDIYKNFIKKGVVRIDYLVDSKTQEIYIGEVNTIPGSMSFYLWQMSFDGLLDGLVLQAMRDKEREDKLQKSFSSCVLDKFSNGSKMPKL